MLYGLMTEEINYSYDGGLYGELVNNRVIGGHWGALEHWVAVTQGDAQASIEVDQKDGPSTALPRSLKLTVKQAGNGRSWSPERRLLGHPRPPQYNLSGFVLRQGRSPGPWARSRSAL